MVFLRSRRTLATLCMHLFKEYARAATTEADGKGNIMSKYFFVSVFTRYSSSEVAKPAVLCPSFLPADTEFHELIRKEHKLGVLYCVLVKANF